MTTCRPQLNGPLPTMGSLIEQTDTLGNLRGTAGVHSDDPSGTPKACARHIRDNRESSRTEEVIQGQFTPTTGDSGWHKCGRFRVRIALVAGEPGGPRRNWISELCFGKRGRSQGSE